MRTRRVQISANKEGEKEQRIAVCGFHIDEHNDIMLSRIGVYPSTKYRFQSTAENFRHKKYVTSVVEVTFHVYQLSVTRVRFLTNVEKNYASL